MQGLSPVAASGGHSSSRYAGLSLLQPLLLRSTGSRRAGSVIVAHGPICSAACGIFPDQGPNPRPLHWQADSQPLRHQGSPTRQLFNHPGALSQALDQMETIKLFAGKKKRKEGRKKENTVTLVQNRHRCPSTDEWIKNMWCIYTMEYYSAIKKKNEIGTSLLLQ